ncbi:NtaA/DmoA family FMN-dependent monooxygenase [Haloplanus halobius]|uniref:NtaA/DmoA family FMN-dependent monooxygenase n=1 Tax=Haloplanus halobius TaxID=2934938 RepID=UPI00200C63B9|nr:NtaA/DmoA family FMN-dependent monooxygenase [Haloplanus sp. XH21]
MLDLIAYTNCSHSPAVEDAWKASDHGQAAGYCDVDFWTDLARRLERGGFSALFFADAFNVASQYQGSIRPTVRHGEQLPENDPLPLLSALGAATDSLGLVATASTSFYPPYLLAKKLSTIDHLTDGRLGWNIVTSSGELEFRNVAGEYVPHDERYEIADESLEVCYRLWEDSWDDDAVVTDAESGTYADPDAVSFIDHDGEYFEVPGPHMCAPSPQRTPMLFQAGQSERGREFAARHAEATFSFHLSREGFETYAADVVDRAADYGRSRADIRFYPAVTPYVAPTTADAEALYDRVLDYIDPETGLVRLSNHFNHDYSQYDRDAPLADLPVEGIRGALKVFIEDDHEWTVGEAAKRYARYPAVELVGDGDTVASELERWHAAGADGFVVLAPLVPRSFEAVCEHLVPELRARGSLADAPPAESLTLRERLFDRRDDATLAASHPAWKCAPDG